MDTYVVEPTSSHTATLFFLHGSGGGASQIAAMLRSRAVQGDWRSYFKVIVPEAYVPLHCTNRNPLMRTNVA
jgi:predicted esterase